jgi:ribosomal protein S6
MFIFSSTLKDEALEKMLERIRGDIAKLNGAVVSTEVLGTRTFARPMQKRDAGLYVKMTVSLDPKDVAAFKVKCRLNEDIFRVQVLNEAKVKAKAAPPAAKV